MQLDTLSVGTTDEVHTCVPESLASFICCVQEAQAVFVRARFTVNSAVADKSQADTCDLGPAVTQRTS